MKTKKRFSLIELLITIAIIAILAGLLLPALNAARNKAKAAACISNLKQCGLVIRQYADENDDYMMMEDTSLCWHGWAAYLYQVGYLKETGTMYFCPASEYYPPAAPGGEWALGDKAMTSLSFLRIGKYAYTSNYKGFFVDSWNTTRAQTGATPNWNGDVENRAVAFKKLSNYVQPSEFFLLADGTKDGRHNNPKYWDSNTYFWRIHSAKYYNMLFADGHAEAKNDAFILKKVAKTALFK